MKLSILVNRRFILGAGGAMGTDAVAKAPADGYTLLLTTTGTLKSMASRWSFR